MSTTPQQPLLSIRGLLKVFPALTALDEVSLDVGAGEVVAVVGHNGSGKSTLVKILAGVYSANAGEVSLAEGAQLHFIHQDLGLIAELSAAENLELAKGTGSRSIAPTHPRAERAHTDELIGRFAQRFDTHTPVRNLTTAQRAIVAIARALDGWTHSSNVLVLDEPTESLHRSEVDVLFDAVRQVAAQGTGVIFVSHRLDEVFELADRVVVLRDGKKVADRAVDALAHHELIELIAGTELTPIDDGHTALTGQAEPVLTARRLGGGSVQSLDLDVAPGEIVGIAGVLGSGREAVPGLIFGAVPSYCEDFRLHGDVYDNRTPQESLRRGIAFVPGDRARLGVIRDMTARENLTLPQLRTLTTRWGNISAKRERAEGGALLAEYDVKPPRLEQRISLFSGGNQQKIVIARALRDAPAILLLDEPTQGVDVGAKATIYQAIRAGAHGGTGVVVSSSDAKELAALCHRVVVLRDGEAAAILSGDDLTEHRIIAEGYGLPIAAPPPAAAGPIPDTTEEFPS
ncbi:ribose ABC transporter ATP-binding protein RbsA [Microbacterium sediminicola]|uniref:Ribose ABC transporter ATP-binding protein RbsA n=1 Tax=Microbacterium sediminicola TaxID=415210 RepID=A0ABN2HI93_9MICO